MNFNIHYIAYDKSPKNEKFWHPLSRTIDRCRATALNWFFSFVNLFNIHSQAEVNFLPIIFSICSCQKNHHRIHMHSIRLHQRYTSVIHRGILWITCYVYWKLCWLSVLPYYVEHYFEIVLIIGSPEWNKLATSMYDFFSLIFPFSPGQFSNEWQTVN